jgi:hypothetical protein
MRKSEKYSVAIFLAVALFAGTIAGSSAPALVDAQATEDKRDYKEKDRNYDKDYRHDDNKRYGDENKYGDDGRDKYSKDRDDRYGHEDQYSTYGKDKYGQDDYGKDKYGQDDYGKDKYDKSVKNIKCNNVNINGKDRNHGGHDNWPRGGGNEWFGNSGSEWPRGGGDYGFSHDSYMKPDNHNFPGFIKQTDKDVVVICIFNNDDRDKNMTKPPVKVPKDCIDCIEDLPGQFPSGMDDNQANGTGLVRDFVDALFAGADILGLDDTQTGLEILNEFCDNLEMGMYDEDTITTLVQMAIPGSDNANFSMALLECLLDIIDKDNNHGNPHW